MSSHYLTLPPWAKSAIKKHPFVVGVVGAPAAAEAAAGTLAALISVGLLCVIVRATKNLPAIGQIGRTSNFNSAAFRRAAPKLYKRAA